MVELSEMKEEGITDMRIRHIKECFKNLWRNRLMSVASITSVAATLLILGIIFVLIINMTSIAEGLKEQFDEIQIYLIDELEMEQIDNLIATMKTFVGVESVYFETKDDALVKLKDSWKENAYLLEGLDKNPLPNSIILSLYDIGYGESVVDQIRKLEGIEEIKFHQDVVVRVIDIANYIKNIGMVIIFVLVAISTFIIHNTIKLAVNARYKEINIMKFVGATSWFVRWPFFLEGTVLGIFGSMLSLAVMYLIYLYTYGFLSSKFYVIISPYLVTPDAIVMDLLVLFLVIGAGIGGLGSLLSMRRHLHV